MIAGKFSSFSWANYPGASRIIASIHRPKRPPRKRKATAIAWPVVVRKRNKIDAVPPRHAQDHPPSANDDRKLLSPGARKPVIVTTTQEAGAAYATDDAEWRKMDEGKTWGPTIPRPMPESKHSSPA